jgi:uncharacterized membrane protein (UPF0182 family)
MMFAIAYLILILVSAIPLARTLLTYRDAPRSVALAHRIYRDLAYVAGSVLLIVAFEMAVRISLENYWFSELGQQYRYWISLGLRVAIFCAVFVFGGLFIGFNLRLACRSAAVLPPSAPWFAGFIISALVALGSIDLWTPLTAFLGATPSGATDPVFARDLSFYLLALPLYERAVGLVTTIIVLAILAWLGVGLLVFPRLMRRWRRRGPQLALVEDGETWAADDRPPPVRAKAWDAWLAQGMMLGALLCLAWGFGRYFSLYHLVINGRSAVVAGASWGDVRFLLPAYGVTIALWLAAALTLGAAALQPRLRRWLIEPSHVVAAVGVFAATYLVALIVPVTVEGLYVGPNQITLEQPYLVRSIAGTRRAYGLEAPNLEEKTFAVSASPISREDLDNNATTLRDARIWDWRALEPQLQQTQGLRPYYTFSEVDIDRYRIDGDERQVMVTARELDVARLPPPAQVWVNLALKYTHGYGVVAVPANEIDDRGNPVLWAHDIPIQAKGDLVVTHGEIYYGMQTRNRVYVHTTEKEFDFPRGDANAETVYGGAGGIRLSNFWRRLVIARQFDGLRLFISNYFTSQSRVLIRRNVV